MPGIWMQNITTKEPDEGMLEVAITSLKCALRDDYPEFMEFYQDRPWEPKEIQNESADSESNTELDGAEAEARSENTAEITETSAEKESNDA
jgi:hypothetical protein